MDTLLNVYDWIGRMLALPGLIALFGLIYSLLTGTLVILYRLGRGLKRRRIAIFARKELSFLKNMLTDSGYFHERDLIEVSDPRMDHRARDAHLFLVSWQDCQDKDRLSEILKVRWQARDAALIIYAPPGRIPQEEMATLANQPHTIVVNFPGRLLNDVILSLITTSLTRQRRNAAPSWLPLLSPPSHAALGEGAILIAAMTVVPLHPAGGMGHTPAMMGARTIHWSHLECPRPATWPGSWAARRWISPAGSYQAWPSFRIPTAPVNCSQKPLLRSRWSR